MKEILFVVLAMIGSVATVVGLGVENVLAAFGIGLLFGFGAFALSAVTDG